MNPTRVLIAGAAGRDFHNFNLVYRGNQNYEVVAFTATQIPNIEGRIYPAELAGDLYPRGIPILPESALEELIREHEIDDVVFAYSDVTHDHVMHVGSRALAAGASYRLISPQLTMLRSAKPCVAVCAVRTGSGKSQTTRHVAALLRDAGKRVAVLRHPMPYGDLTKQAVQRFERYEDLEAADATIEEREEYEPHLAEGNIVFAGIDYGAILARAEQEADVIVWDGGNNDTPFIHPDLHIVVVDPHRAGHELRYHPGETNLRMADVCVVNKVDSAPQPAADDGAAVLAARAHGARELVDPRPFAVGSIADTLAANPHVESALPAMGYGVTQVLELRETILRSRPELVLVGTPVDLRRLIDLDVPALRVTYRLEEIGEPTLADLLAERGLLDQHALV